MILIKPGQLFTLVTLMNYKAKYNSSSNCNEFDKVWQWFTLAKTVTYRIHGNIRPRSIFAPVALDACRRANLRLGEFETFFIDFYRLCIPVLIKISLFFNIVKMGAKLGRKKHRAKNKCIQHQTPSGGGEVL